MAEDRSEAQVEAALQTDILMHYHAHTSGTFDCLSPRSQDFWRTFMPALAYTSRVVRLGMLTMAALCLSNDIRTSDSERSKYYVQIAETYGREFVAICSQNAQHPELHCADVHMTYSRLLTMLALAWYSFDRQHRGIRLVDEEAWAWLHMIRGSAAMQQRYKLAGLYDANALANELADAAQEVDAADSYKQHPAFGFIANTREARFAALCDGAARRAISLGPGAAKDVFSAIASLEKMTEELCTGNVSSLFRSLCFWPCRINKGFVELLEQGNMLALAIYAYWLMPMSLVRDAWFIDGMSQTGILEICRYCDASQSADLERELLIWPRKMAEDPSLMLEPQ
ncbi:hypothetical protein KC332_g6696 [Hortaea werneckii]|nr:hypothetical protein KC358_g12547 [Hortaea werneckii]KAI6837540.1 hypothetical protein KC350_g6036 [Hortaea werneckii]KAI6914950.1 hypothetical protein KC348_g12160 [Hortaea werneckii]KAI6928081.1 hypothetical protein KC341_g11750 [Hortaea werneckii]KAI6968330.1 hypothetical protein KC321_g8520 [Hortaea werneckii]